MKIERVNSQTVKFGDASVRVSDVMMVPDIERENITINVKNGTYSPKLIISKKFGFFQNPAGVAYTSFADATAAIAAAIAEGDGVSSVLSDKAAVTQATNKTTTVVSNTLNTKITTVALTDAADAAFSFAFTNSKITTASNVLATVDMNAGTGKAIITITPGAGTATITVTNAGTAAFNTAIKIGLVVL